MYLWDHKRRYNAVAEYYRKTFGERVQKVSVDAGFTCPNRDGTLGTGGCTYCNNDAFNPSYCVPSKPVSLQIREGIEFHARRYRRAGKYLAYFQAYTNTYQNVEKLEALYREALDCPGVMGLVVATRPDCLDEEILELLKKLAAGHYLIVEFGVESCYNRTLERINRGHTYEQSAEAIIRTHEAGIRTGVHLIFGLPGESRDDMLREADILSALPVDHVKFHQLQVLHGAAMADEYRLDPDSFRLFGLKEYIDFIIEFVERLNPRIMIERFAGEVPPGFLIAPAWGLVRNDQISLMVEKRMAELDTWQGKRFRSCSG
jgi:radical SAM protein (TIGR01212 family)